MAVASYYFKDDSVKKHFKYNDLVGRKLCVFPPNK